MFVSLRRDWPAPVFRRTVKVDARPRQIEFRRGELLEVDDALGAALRPDVGHALEIVEPTDRRHLAHRPPAPAVVAGPADEEDEGFVPPAAETLAPAGADPAAAAPPASASAADAVGPEDLVRGRKARR